MFSVVSIIREEPEIIRYFLDYHFALGAAKIFVFFDGPEGDAIGPALERRYGDRLAFRTMAMDDYPEEPDHRPIRRFETRQDHIHKLAQAASPTDWLITLDADEFLILRDPLAAMLAAVPKSVASVNIPVAEAVWGPDDTFGAAFGCTYLRAPFRRPFRGHVRAGYPRFLRRHLARWVYGADGWMFEENVAGHSSGRHFFRRSAAFDYIGPHDARRGGTTLTRRARRVLGRRATAQIAHFDAISFDRWVEKFRRRIDREIRSDRERAQRRRQFEDFEAAYRQMQETGDRAALEALMKRFYSLSARQVAQLTRLRCLLRVDAIGRLARGD